MRGSLIRCCTKRIGQAWLTESKFDRMSASRIKFTFLVVMRWQCPTCSPLDSGVQIREPELEVCLVVLPPSVRLHRGAAFRFNSKNASRRREPSRQDGLESGFHRFGSPGPWASRRSSVAQARWQRCMVHAFQRL
jgi:hypothetical protein